jgi:hypothetical protein
LRAVVVFLSFGRAVTFYQFSIKGGNLFCWLCIFFDKFLNVTPSIVSQYIFCARQ